MNPKLRDWLVSVSPFAEVFLGLEILPPFLEVENESSRSFTIASKSGRTTFDHRRRVIRRDGKMVAAYRDVKTVDIKVSKSGGGGQRWVVSLYISFFRRVRIGESRDDVTASIIAARIATALNCEVLSLVPRGL